MSIKRLPKSLIEFEISVPWSEWEKYLEQAAKEASEEIKIAGFRPGMAPRNLVEQKVGKGLLFNNAAEKAVKKSYVDFVTKEKLEVIGSPEVDIKDIEEGKDLVYVAKVAVVPEITIKETYKKEIVKINEANAKKDNTPSEEAIKLELDKLANSRVKLVTVNREAKKNDSVEVDFQVFRDGTPIENGTSQKHPLILGRGVFIPGFEENLIGMSAGEEKEFELNFPEEYHQKELAGKPATFKVKMSLVQERQTPEVNDEFAQSMGEFKDLEALKKSVQDGLLEENLQKAKENRIGEYVEKIVANSEVDLPEVLVHEEIHTMLHEFEQQISGMGMTLEDYLKKLGKDREELEKEWEPQAAKRVTSGMALKKIAEQEKLEASQEEIEQEMNKVFQYYKNVKDIKKNIDMEKLYNYSKGVVENEKVFKYFESL